MLLVIMTNSLIRFDNTVRTSLNDDCMTNSHDDRRGRARTETDRDSHAEGTSPAAIPFPPLSPSLHPIPNQSKPIVPLLSFSFITTFSYIFITISYNL